MNILELTLQQVDLKSISHLTFSSSGRWLAAIEPNKHIHVWNLETLADALAMKQLAKIPQPLATEKKERSTSYSVSSIQIHAH